MKITLAQIDKDAYNEGKRANREGLDTSSNPYAYSLIQHHCWLNGWWDAEREYDPPYEPDASDSMESMNG